MSIRRPVVILAGFLGSHPKNLQRHVQMYDRLGYNTLIRIASPASVMHAIIHGPTATTSDTSKNHIMEQNNSSLEMKHLAINTLQHIQQLQPSHFIIHIFSNNGCFLWEWIRFILFHQSYNDSDETNIDTTQQQHQRQECFHNIDAYNLQNKLRGIIFDSAPAYYGGDIDGFLSALEYVDNNEERQSLIKMAKSLNANQVKRRHNEFWIGLCNDDTHATSSTKFVPQLYLYSDCDILTNAKYLEELILHRQQLIGKERIWSRKFIGSSHCGHLKKYPIMYEQSVEEFLEFFAANDGCRISRL
jgi:hypothetical protein